MRPSVSLWFGECCLNLTAVMDGNLTTTEPLVQRHIRQEPSRRPVDGEATPAGFRRGETQQQGRNNQPTKSTLDDQTLHQEFRLR